MGKHARKRQKTSKSGQVQPLGSKVSLTDDASKDDEERRLESLLFGTPFVPSVRENKDILVLSGDEQDALLVHDKELEHLADMDLFYVDEGEPSTSKDVPNLDVNLDAPGDSSHQDSDGDPEQKSDDEEAEPSHPAEPMPPPSRTAPAWADPDDTTLKVSLASDNRLRKLRDAPSDDAVGGREYERRLRRQYEKINPTPKWALIARKKLRPAKAKRRRSLSGSSDSEDDEDEGLMDDILSSTAGILGTKQRSKQIPKETLAIERLRDANQSAKAEGAITVVQFHPSHLIPVLLTASADRRLRLFNIDGLTNPHLQTLHIPSLPLTNALFHPSGSSVLLTGPRPFYYTHNLQSGTTHRSPRGLWGTTFSNANPSAQDASMEICAFSPTGAMLAVAGRRGYVHLVDWGSGAGQVVGSLKMNAGVKSLWWARDGAGGGRELMGLGQDAEVYVWDVGERRCVKRWQDDGGFGSRVMDGDRGGKYLAIGANTGFVNVYGADGQTSSSNNKPKPLKTIGNLVTPISTVRFNHDSQLLAIASDAKKDQMRMIHLPSLTAFANWPTSSTPLGRVTSIDFSAGSEYVAVGNTRGRVLLYHLRDFGTHS